MTADRMPWFKWWDGTAADMKFRMVADDCKLPVACIVGAWAYLLEHASRATERGSIAGVDLEVMAYTLMLPDCETVCNAMKRRKLFHEDGTVAKWEERQAKREKGEPSGASTARVQRYRDKLKADKDAKENKGLDAAAGFDGDSNGGVTDETDETAGNGTKRPKKKNREEVEKKPKTLTPSSSDDDGVSPFDQFWKAYPRKVGKQDALKAWTKLKPYASLVTTILAAIAAQREGADWRRDDGQYIPHPATWLNAGRWLDEVRPYVEPPLKLPPGWWETPEGMKKAGAMLTPPLSPNKGEFQKDFANRIRAALGQVDAPPAGSAAPPMLAPAPYIPPTVPDSVQLTPEQQQARKDEFREALATMKNKAKDQAAGVPIAETA